MDQATRTFTAEYLKSTGATIFRACGAPEDEAAIVADHLVESNLMGLDSHGIIRVIWYAQEAQSGSIKPGAPTVILKETPTTAVVDCGFNFGPVSASRMADIVANKARSSGIACVISRNCHHVSRLGAYPQRIAEHGLFGLAFANSTKHGHYVVPWGGRKARLATNPLSYAVPAAGYPIVFDTSTSMISEGKLRVLLHEGKPVPPGCILDAEGNPSTDVRDFYGPPMGTILPFGMHQGYKGFGLGLLTEILGGILAGTDSTSDEPGINGVCMIAVNPSFFCGADDFARLVDSLCTYITGTPPAPGYDEVMLPGMLDFRTREKRLAEGLPLAEDTWRQILDTAERLGVIIEPPK